MRTIRKAVRRIDKDSVANKNRKVSDFHEVDVAHLDDVVSGSCLVSTDKVKTNTSDIYAGESFHFQETQPDLTINEPDPVTASVAVDPSIGKGKRKVDDLYNSSIDAFIAGSQTPEHYMSSLESIVCNMAGDTSFHSKGCSSSMSLLNNVNNSVHVNEAIRRRVLTLPAIQDDRSSPGHMSRP